MQNQNVSLANLDTKMIHQLNSRRISFIALLFQLMPLFSILFRCIGNLYEEPSANLIDFSQNVLFKVIITIPKL